MRISRRMQHVGLLALITYIIMIGGATYSNLNVFVRIFHHTVITAVFLGWLINLIRRQRPFPATALDLPLAGVVIWLLVTTVTSLDWRVSLETNWVFIGHVLGIYLLVDVMRTRAQRWLFEALFLVAALVIVVSVVEFVSWYFGLGFAGFTQNWLSIGGTGDPIPPIIYRLSLALNVSTWLGAFVVLMLPLVVGWALTARKKQDRQALWMVAVGLAWVLLFSQSRGAMLGIMAVAGMSGLLWLLHRYGFNLGRLLIVGGGIVAVSGAAAALLIFLVTQQRAGGDTGGSDAGRRKLWEGAIEIFQDHPLTGVGTMQFNYAVRRYVVMDDHAAHLATAHNIYLNTLAELGLPGLLLMLWLGGAFLWLWWNLWQAAPTAHRIRLGAVLAALSGLAIQSLVDTFTFTSTLLPVLIMVAYILVQKPIPVRPVYRWLPQAAAIGVALYTLWLASIDAGQFRFFQALLAIGRDEPETALERIEQAQAFDPAYRLYDLQKAYVLGVLAQDDPVRLDQAIAAYEQIQITDPHFDIGHANLAALYAQRGDAELAAATMQQAVDLRPDINFYWLKLGDYQSAAGQAEVAQMAYENAIRLTTMLPTNSRFSIMMMMQSAYWQQPDPSREQAVEALYQEQAPYRNLLLAVQLHQPDRAETFAQALTAPNSLEDYTALGYWAAAQEQWADAIRWFEAALTFNQRQGWLYAELAAAYLAQGNTAQAERYARTALFTDPATGRRGHYILYQLEPAAEPALTEKRLIEAVPPRTLIPVYDNPVFGHIGLLAYLPQLQIPGTGAETYTPWLILAERYASDNDPDTEPATIYEAILENDPFITEVRELCGEACE